MYTFEWPIFLYNELYDTRNQSNYSDNYTLMYIHTVIFKKMFQLHKHWNDKVCLWMSSSQCGLGQTFRNVITKPRLDFLVLGKQVQQEAHRVRRRINSWVGQFKNVIKIEILFFGKKIRLKKFLPKILTQLFRATVLVGIYG
jgi:hypothetical protein